MKGHMKKILIALSAAALLAGCASQDNNGMGGTSDEVTIQSQGTVQSQDTMKTDAIGFTLKSPAFGTVESQFHTQSNKNAAIESSR